jgi:hypothetical protein
MTPVFLVLALAATATATATTAPAAPTLTVDERSHALKLEAVDAPLAVVLERIAERLQIRLVFEGPRPEMKVSASIAADNARALLESLLEPRHMRYATAIRKDDGRIETLVVVTGTSDPRAPVAVAPPPPEPRPQPFAHSVPEPVLPDHVSAPDEP